MTLFAQDLEYRHSSIIYLARFVDLITAVSRLSSYRHLWYLPLVFANRTCDVEVFSVALSLAKRHHVPESEVYLALLNWLLVDSG